MTSTLTHAGHNTLSLRELQDFDPSIVGLALGQGGERRCLCPLCGHSKPRDAAHRCLSLNLQSGLWRCYRCGEAGKVRDAWEERSSLPHRECTRLDLARAFAMPALPTVEAAVTLPQIREMALGKSPGNMQRDSPAQPSEQSPEKPSIVEWKRNLRGLRAIEDTRGAAYLRGRGLSAEVACAAGVRFSPSFLGRPALVFALRDQVGALCGAHARYVDGRDRPKARTLGDKRRSLFATADAFSPVLPVLIATEAPLDALSLAQAGYPAVAFCGTQAPSWFHRACAFRRVLLAFDTDDAGERAADQLAPVLESFGARCERLIPENAKDWNEALQSEGCDALADWLATRVLMG